MRTSLQLLLFALFSFTAVYASVNSTQLKCESSPLYVLYEKYYEGHPFRNVNLAKNSTHWDVRDYKVQFNSMSNYRLRSKVGSGTFSNVFKTTYIPDGTRYAFKQLVHNREAAIRREIKIMKDVGDLPNVLPIRDMLREQSSDGETRTALIFDFFRTTNYKDLSANLNKYELKYFIYETLRTLHYAHSRGIVHRDIKPLNVLMSSERLETRVIDWGHSDYFLPGKKYSIFVSSLHFKSPELLLGYEYHDYSLDIWSTGCMLAEMAFLKDPFFKAKKYTPLPEGAQNETAIKMERFAQQLDAIAQVLGTLKLKQYVDKFRDQMDVRQLEKVGDYKKQPLTNFINSSNAHLVDDKLIDVLDKMLTIDHTKRPTAADVLMHPYFDEVRQQNVFSSSSDVSDGKMTFEKLATKTLTQVSQ